MTLKPAPAASVTVNVKVVGLDAKTRDVGTWDQPDLTLLESTRVTAECGRSTRIVWTVDGASDLRIGDSFHVTIAKADL